MKKFRIKEIKYSDNTSSFQAQYFMGDSYTEMGYSSDGWISISNPKDTYRKALLKLNSHRRGKIKLVRVYAIKIAIETIIHEVK